MPATLTPVRLRRNAYQGFTLLELLITLSIAAAAVGGAVLALPDSGLRALEHDAQRLAAQLEVARAQSRASGQAVWAQVQSQGWQWQGLVPLGASSGSGSDRAGGGLAPAAQQWLHADTQAGEVRVQLGPEPVIAAQHVQLWNAKGQRVWVSTDGVRPFAVVPQP